MNFAQDTFISSSFWTESTGFAAAIKISRYLMKKMLLNFWLKQEIILVQGFRIAKENLKIKINEFKPLISFKFLDFENRIS